MRGVRVVGCLLLRFQAFLISTTPHHDFLLLDHPAGNHHWGADHSYDPGLGDGSPFKVQVPRLQELRGDAARIGAAFRSFRTGSHLRHTPHTADTIRANAVGTANTIRINASRLPPPPCNENGFPAAGTFVPILTPMPITMTDALMNSIQQHGDPMEGVEPAPLVYHDSMQGVEYPDDVMEDIEFGTQPAKRERR
ncbi:hypothetical protein BC938DRAFT_472880 [Jimgerdemannia flammicorona]|uniref:Uncharacterized protein n=1 Tax=Jimgerdemannia flammicorona TaxID=994334 RepID=A0A433QTR3_9FUNG|nr:hypothetical protein BC938DRAFT_472880 [Jimgerdemannia flammicorona]